MCEKASQLRQFSREIVELGRPQGIGLMQLKHTLKYVESPGKKRYLDSLV